jgi:uncharacterized protein YecT (DUF1311 family)
MKAELLIAILFLPAFCVAQTQGDSNAEADKIYRAADRELNTVYQQILQDYKSDAAFTGRIKASQRIWIQFRDAELLARYPAKDARLEYGSAYPMCWSIYMTDLTKERTKQLRVWIDGIEEGDVCSGSVRTKR